MTYYLAKTSTNNFDLSQQASDFNVIMGIENKFFVCQSSEVPVCDFVVEFPQEYFDNLYLFPFANGKKLKYDPSNGRIPFTNHEETKRIVLNFLPEQFIARLELLRWIALNAYLNNMQQLLQLSNEEYEQYKKNIDQISNDVEMKQYTVTNLYYDL